MNTLALFHWANLQMLNDLSNEIQQIIIIFYQKLLIQLRKVPFCMCLLGHRTKMEGNQV